MVNGLVLDWAGLVFMLYNYAQLSTCSTFYSFTQSHTFIWRFCLYKVYFSIPAGRVGDQSTNLPFFAQSAPSREPHPSQLPITSYLFQNKHLHTTKLYKINTSTVWELCWRSKIKLNAIHVHISSIIDLEKSFKCVNGSNTQ